MHTYSDYLQFLNDLSQTFGSLTELEQEKAEAVRRRDLDALQDCMKREQAISLALRGQERKRQAILRDLGLDNVALRETERRCPPELRRSVADAVERVLRACQVLKSAQESSRVLMEGQLHRIDAQLQKRGLRGEDDLPAAPGGMGAAGRTDMKI